MQIELQATHLLEINFFGRQDAEALKKRVEEVLKEFGDNNSIKVGVVSDKSGDFVAVDAEICEYFRTGTHKEILVTDPRVITEETYDVDPEVKIDGSKLKENLISAFPEMEKSDVELSFYEGDFNE